MRIEYGEKDFELTERTLDRVKFVDALYPILDRVTQRIQGVNGERVRMALELCFPKNPLDLVTLSEAGKRITEKYGVHTSRLTVGKLRSMGLNAVIEYMSEESRDFIDRTRYN